ncbi:MAG: type I restriction enzyme HsdR N-terminal domain-containing protein [Selenomonadaceae bacterium]|nr:type I restriction enzyme HsdR N-terminal domain-containing protein [Selenomonadaceae bacterium]
MTLNDILNGTKYTMEQFDEEGVKELISRTIVKTVKGKATLYVTCPIRQKEIKLTPEEIVRQLYLRELTTTYGYPVERLQVEYTVTIGRDKKRADIAVMDKDRPDSPYIIVECKEPNLKDGKEQLKSYCNATGAPIGVWTNGRSMKRGCNGTILTAISREELERIPIPLPAKNIQAKISAKVKESFALREQSKTLLKSAVKAVEIAIEDGEEKAMEYLRENH